MLVHHYRCTGRSKAIVSRNTEEAITLQILTIFGRDCEYLFHYVLTLTRLVLAMMAVASSIANREVNVYLPGCRVIWMRESALPVM